MHALGIGPGPTVGQAKTFLLELVLEGELAPDDREGALLRLDEFRRTVLGDEFQSGQDQSQQDGPADQPDGAK